MGIVLVRHSLSSAMLLVAGTGKGKRVWRGASRTDRGRLKCGVRR